MYYIIYNFKGVFVIGGGNMYRYLTQELIILLTKDEPILYKAVRKALCNHYNIEIDNKPLRGVIDKQLASLLEIEAEEQNIYKRDLFLNIIRQYLNLQIEKLNIKSDHINYTKNELNKTPARDIKKPEKCTKCGYGEFKSCVHDHHEDHDHDNNNEENLNTLCSNCHDEYHNSKEAKIKRVVKNNSLVRKYILTPMNQKAERSQVELSVESCQHCGCPIKQILHIFYNSSRPEYWIILCPNCYTGVRHWTWVPKLESYFYVERGKILPRVLLDKKCVRCEYDKNDSVIHKHHIDKDRTNNIISNILPLCSNCHDALHFGYWKLEDIGIEVPKKKERIKYKKIKTSVSRMNSKDEKEQKEIKIEKCIYCDTKEKHILHINYKSSSYKSRQDSNEWIVLCLNCEQSLKFGVWKLKDIGINRINQNQYNDEQFLQVILNSNIPLSTQDIANEVGSCWSATELHLIKLEKENMIKSIEFPENMQAKKFWCDINHNTDEYLGISKYRIYKCNDFLNILTNIPITTAQICTKTGFAWDVIQTYLPKLKAVDKIKRIKHKNSNFWIKPEDYKPGVERFCRITRDKYCDKDFLNTLKDGPLSIMDIVIKVGCDKSTPIWYLKKLEFEGKVAHKAMRNPKYKRIQNLWMLENDEKAISRN